MKKTTKKNTTAAKKPRFLSHTKAARDARARRRRLKKLVKITRRASSNARAQRAVSAHHVRRGKLLLGIAPAPALTRETTIIVTDGRGEMQPYVNLTDNFGDVHVTQRCERIRVVVILKGRTHRFDVVRQRH